MAKGGSSSTTTVSPTNISTDQSASAGGAGSLAVGAGAKVNITDAGISKAALSTAENTAGVALAANQNVSLGAIGSNERLATAAVQSSANLAANVSNTVAGLAQVNQQENQSVLDTTNTALQSAGSTVAKLSDLASGALERTQTPSSQTDKTLLYVIGAIGVAFALALAFAFRKNSR